jgi:hypothetical protein
MDMTLFFPAEYRDPKSEFIKLGTIYHLQKPYPKTHEIQQGRAYGRA